MLRLLQDLLASSGCMLLLHTRRVQCMIPLQSPLRPNHEIHVASTTSRSRSTAGKCDAFHRPQKLSKEVHSLSSILFAGCRELAEAQWHALIGKRMFAPLRSSSARHAQKSGGAVHVQHAQRCVVHLAGSATSGWCAAMSLTPIGQHDGICRCAGAVAAAKPNLQEHWSVKLDLVLPCLLPAARAGFVTGLQQVTNGSHAAHHQS